MPKGRPGQVRWTKEMDEIVRQDYPEYGPEVLADRLKVPRRVLINRANYLGVRVSKGFRWTPEAEQAVKDRYAADGPKTLAEELGTTAMSVTAKARRMGLDSTRKKPPKDFEWTDEMLAELTERYVAEGGQVLADEFGLAVDTVRRKASSLGLHTIAGHAIAGQKRAEENDRFNIRYFNTWSDDMAYILGFLFADGCINKRKTTTTICIAFKDESVLDFVKDCLKSSQEIYHQEGGVDERGSVIQPRSTLMLFSTVMVKSLAALGMHPRKTYRDDPFPAVPDEHMPHFIRGYFDGDGCVCITEEFCSVSFVGSPRFITGLRDSLMKYAGMACKAVEVVKGKTTDWATVNWSANRDVRLFREFAYPEGFSFGLERKRAKLFSWVELERRENSPHRRFTPDEEDIIRNYYHLIGPAAVARMLDRDRGTVFNKAMELGLRVDQ